MNHYRTIWISDVHLGSLNCNATVLLDFLKYNNAEKIYLVGDIIDGWMLKKKWYWPQEHNDVIQKLLRKARNGASLIYIPGNHDEGVRQFVGLSFGEISIKRDDIHMTLHGEKLWVTHGDQMDPVMFSSKWASKLGDFLYGIVTFASRIIHKMRQIIGYEYWSLSTYLKGKAKNAVRYVQRFERLMADEAQRKGHVGLVCGHIHQPAKKIIGGIQYYNTGDWVDSGSVLVEKNSGEIELVYWKIL
ncbi:MAG: UDP-2,3-diacylglucosamine diphosphatase [SAR92 clade bacterium]|uniref:UDP-2,3-diacylglucosamine diphosphatase n=1 Tax=SAR92 clade bacterium TaxID=2315479 RepID=A0A520LLH4_9GAMM|nr:MAG: UDP-2,3-diacylglucosamine diphosphatase [SAR92 clade bacterium]|tara:strand:+ start:4882 stop:5616 length:735 start_codon:yes stop_codon:yes gene_type:complete